MKSRLPAYSSFLDAYHAAFSKELQRMVDNLPICTGDRVLDMGCGDGIYTNWLAARVAPRGEVVAVDLDDNYLETARQRLRKSAYRSLIRIEKGNINRLPFPNDYFDVAWCAQSLFSFPDPLQTLQELTRVTHSGGVVAILENDSLHQFLLPWPIRLELAIARAEFDYGKHNTNHPEKYYVARDLRNLFVKAGLRPQRKHVYASERETPFSRDEHMFLELYLAGVWKRTKNYLSRAMRKDLWLLVNPKSKNYFLNQDNVTLTSIDQVVWGKKI